MLDEAAAQLSEPATDRVEERLAAALADAPQPPYVYGLKEWPLNPDGQGVLAPATRGTVG
jgi:hypothetical protein